MKKVIKLTESDLVRLVKKVINEQATARAGFGRREVTLPTSNSTDVTIPMLIALTKQASRTNNGFINVLNRISDREMLLSFLSELTKKTGKSFDGYINQAFTEANGPEALAIHRLLKSKFNVDSNPGVKGTNYMRDRQRVFQKNFKITNLNDSTVVSRPDQAPVNNPNSSTIKSNPVKNKSIDSTKGTVTADKSPIDRSEYTDLPGVTVTADRIPMNKPELSVIPTNAVKLGIQKKLEQKMSGEQLFNLFVQNKLMDNFTDSGGYQNRRIVYKGDPLSKENVTLLTDYLVSKGYGRRFSEVDDKRYGKKYVWVRS
jgi:hypothetical protein